MDTGSRESIIAPRNTVVVANNRWADDSVADIDYTSNANAGNDQLDPGEMLTAVEAETTRQDEWLALRAVATTAHGADIDNDGNTENIVQYNFGHKAKTASDRYNELSGLSTTLPFGSIGRPVELIPGRFVGPAKSFRIEFENRSDGFASPTNVPVENIGAQMHLVVIRGVADPEVV
jgi:hypothetical protein